MSFTNRIYGPSGTFAHGIYTPPYRNDWAWPTYASPHAIHCGPIDDPYCTSNMGIVGGFDSMGFPTCCCPRSGRCHTAPIIPIGDPAVAVTLYPMAPAAYIPV
jgi:hypothetical protein